MFEDLIKQMEKMKQQKVSVPIEPDEKGYIDKQCPSEECKFIFKVNEEDWKNTLRNGAIWCPLCGHTAPAEQWFTIEQEEHSMNEALTVAKGKIHNAIKFGAKKFNRKYSKNSFISMSMKVQGGMHRTYVLPAPAAESMQLEIQCKKCKVNFAVIGSAYFCPACGHNSVTRTFSDSLRKIKAKKENVELVRQALVKANKKDDAELTCRSLIESCIQDGVVAFQRYCDELYKPFDTKKKPPFNVFQRLQQASELWELVIKQGYNDWLKETELTELGILYQKRHLLSHNDGIVDESYIKKSGDDSYKVGQRIIIKPIDIEFLMACLEKLSEGLTKTIAKNL